MAPITHLIGGQPGAGTQLPTFRLVLLLLYIASLHLKTLRIILKPYFNLQIASGLHSNKPDATGRETSCFQPSDSFESQFQPPGLVNLN